MRAAHGCRYEMRPPPKAVKHVVVKLDRCCSAVPSALGRAFRRLARVPPKLLGRVSTIDKVIAARDERGCIGAQERD